MADESKVVMAVGVLVVGSDGDLAKRIESAMAEAVMQCAAEGITTEEKNSWIIRERMAAARQRVLDEAGG